MLDGIEEQAIEIRLSKVPGMTEGGVDDPASAVRMLSKNGFGGGPWNAADQDDLGAGREWRGFVERAFSHEP